jgi:hypothetical protein
MNCPEATQFRQAQASAEGFERLSARCAVFPIAEDGATGEPAIFLVLISAFASAAATTTAGRTRRSDPPNFRASVIAIDLACCACKKLRR